MKKYFFILIGFVVFSLFQNALAAENLIREAQESEIQAIIAEKKIALALAEKNLEYVMDRSRQDQEIDAEEKESIYEDLSILSETMRADTESLLEHAKTFLGMEYNSLPPERGALDSIRVNRAKNMYDELTRSYLIWKDRDPFTVGNEDTLIESMTDTTRSSITLTNKILRLIERSIEISATDENPSPLSLEDSRNIYREFRSMMLENKSSLDELSESLEMLDSAEQIEKKYITQKLEAELEKTRAFSALKKAERMLIQLQKNGTVDFENL